MLDRLFALYHSDEVKKAILAHAQKPRAERKQVAVLFSDVRGFSTFSEGRDPAVVVEHLNAYLSRMVDAIAQEGGVVDKFIGDAVMAVFGGVVDLANPASAALRAARRMRDALAGLHADGIEFESGIGIHFGEVLQGPIGSEHRREFTVIGDTVNIASRVEGLTKEKGVPLLVTGEVYERLSSDERVSFSSLGEAKVKGRAAPVALWG
jgi:class 3 adenylate cyclase